ncbi:helix-turn-helix domain-containing protein [Knoellia sp. CPCC 206435]|uniref:helix-turn-helix domain-containing protein n=1 Tax=Knoellia terrae TaxID=3404797 RepID=UPI003B434DB7
MDREELGGSDMSGEAVGVAMRLARRRLGLSQRALADALAWDRSKVARWECGKVPAGFDEVVALLRVLGFGLAVTDPEASRWAAWDHPAEHVADRGGRRFPAHLVLCSENALSTWNWTRHRGNPSPSAAGLSFRRQTEDASRAEWLRTLEWEASHSDAGKHDEPVGRPSPSESAPMACPGNEAS